MKKDKMQVQKRSSKMRNFSVFGSSFDILMNNIKTAVENIKYSVENIKYSVVPSRTKNDGVIN